MRIERRTYRGNTARQLVDEVFALVLVAVRLLGNRMLEAMVAQMYDTWYEFEGTVRKQEKNLYLQMEDGLSAIKAGVAASTTR